MGTTVSLALDLAIALLQNATAINQLIKTAQDAGRDLTPEEWATITGNDDSAEAQLTAAIAAAKAAGK